MCDGGDVCGTSLKLPPIEVDRGKVGAAKAQAWQPSTPLLHQHQYNLYIYIFTVLLHCMHGTALQCNTNTSNLVKHIKLS